MRRLAGSALVLTLLLPVFSAVGLTGHASAAEPDEIAAVEGSQTPSQLISTDTICSALAAAAAQNDLARLSTNSLHRFIDHASHSMLTEDKATAAKSSQAIRDVVDAARTGQPLTGPRG